MKPKLLNCAFLAAGIAVGIFGISNLAPGKSDDAPKHTATSDGGVSIARGRHLVLIGGCNDCHTPGYGQNPNLPESEWLLGSPVGWRGPWGTSYPSNLRRHLSGFPDAEVWIKVMRSRNGLPPMPWPGLHAATDDELRSIHAFIASLPVTGEIMPAPVPPDKEPATPFINAMPVMPK
jgi:mono/diheme cytochrome c family protein